MTSFLSLRGIEKSFGATRVLDGIDLTIEPGEFVCPVSYTHLRAHET